MAVAKACNGGIAYYQRSWFKYTAPAARKIATAADATVSFGRDNSDYLAGVAVLDANLNIIDCASGDATGTARVGPISLAAGQTVYIVEYTGPAECFDGYCPNEYSDGVGISIATGWSFPVNDNWRDATSVTSLPFTQTVDTTFATEEGQEQFAATGECLHPTAGTPGRLSLVPVHPQYDRSVADFGERVRGRSLLRNARTERTAVPAIRVHGSR